MGKGTSLIYSDRTDVGRRRANNQDSMLVLPPASPQQYRTRGWLFLVADGMGAHAAGEMASGIAAERVPLAYEKAAHRSPLLALRQSIEQANLEINAKGESADELRGMGTTCTTLALLPRGAIVGHVGDSRVYRIRGRTVEQLSRDHSLVWELEAAGGMSREEAAGAAPKNIITRSMGPHPHVDVDLEGPFPVEERDAFLLCSDGLSGQVADDEIGLLVTELEPREATAALLGLALVRGAPDNVTVILVRAGAEEVSRVSAGDEPWSLTEDSVANPGRGALPVRWMSIAAAGLFAALLFFPTSDLMGSLGDVVGTEVGAAVSYIGCAAAVLVAIGAGIMALVGLLAPATGGTRFLHPGRRVGKGPYRSADCTPTEALIERIVASVEAAAAGLGGGELERTLAIIVRARRHVAEKAFHEAVVAIAESLAIYTSAVEQARSGETIRAPSARET